MVSPEQNCIETFALQAIAVRLKRLLLKGEVATDFFCLVSS